MSTLLALMRLARAAVHLTIRVVAGLLSPPRCAACDERIGRGDALFCRPCAVSAVAYEPVRRDRIVAFHYGGAIKTVVTRLKFGGRFDLGPAMGHLLGRAIADAGTEVDVVVPVPLHRDRLIERGYNQASIVAGGVRACIGKEVIRGALVKTRATARQATLDAETRGTNLSGAFSVRDARGIRGRRVLVVDDVTTTGATLEACRSALVAAGAASVVIAAVAAQDRRLPPSSAR